MVVLAEADPELELNRPLAGGPECVRKRRVRRKKQRQGSADSKNEVSGADLSTGRHTRHNLSCVQPELDPESSVPIRSSTNAVRPRRLGTTRGMVSQ